MSRNGFISSISSSFSRLLEEDIPKVLHENKKQQKNQQKTTTIKPKNYLQLKLNYFKIHVLK